MNFQIKIILKLQSFKKLKNKIKGQSLNQISFNQRKKAFKLYILNTSYQFTVQFFGEVHTLLET